MAATGKDPTDPASVTVRASKMALRDEREARLAKALRDNLGRRKGQIRARAAAVGAGGAADGGAGGGAADSGPDSAAADARGSDDRDGGGNSASKDTAGPGKTGG